MTIKIRDPQKHDTPKGSFITYLITTETEVKTFRSGPKPRPVRRRYQDFVWLRTTLAMTYPACIIPPLPEKHRLEYIKGDRFGPDFIQRRLLSLQWFLERISRHPILQQSEAVQIFLESNDFKNDKRRQMSILTEEPTSFLNSIGDTLINAFTTLKMPDERFEDMKENIERLEENLNTIERLYLRINKRQQDLEHDYDNFANSIQGLSALEQSITKPLHQFAETAKAFANVMKDMIEKEDAQFLNELHALLSYCHAAKDTLRARDQKQLDREGLNYYLQQSYQLRDRLHSGSNNRKYNDIKGGMSGMIITDYVTDKLNEVRGVDKQRARREKLARLDDRVKRLRHELEKTTDESMRFNKQVIKEFELFQQAKTLELKQSLIAYADCHIEFYQRGMAIWEKIIPILERMNDKSNDSMYS
ncbi:lipid binding protein [Mycotypha africana]|uniref:lipid binding protein n=1 Tax=Mycotypha africana TaxID=64632 RepID=UPI0023003003|nr:lipid binding protein [Mycotypha africana]KAI8975645.1 lipid binding protein [Mycotypha africana]